MKITTKRGDHGKTVLGNREVEKTDKIVKLLSLLDECLACVSIARVETKLKELNKIEYFLYELMGYINYINPEETKKDRDKKPKHGDKNILDINKWQEYFDNICEKGISDKIKWFVKPNGKAAFIHLARTKVREAEIMCFEVFGNSEISVLMNRLSDVLFIYAYEFQKSEGALEFFNYEFNKD
jgi:ATP:cob(I)alamin adenosyltransferase